MDYDECSFLERAKDERGIFPFHFQLFYPFLQLILCSMSSQALLQLELLCSIDTNQYHLVGMVQIRQHNHPKLHLLFLIFLLNHYGNVELNEHLLDRLQCGVKRELGMACECDHLVR